MAIVYGLICKGVTDGKVRFITPSGRIYMWAYGSWRFYYQGDDSTYKSLRGCVGNKSNVFLASTKKLFMDKRVALDPIDYLAVECVGRRLSKNRITHSHQIARFQQNAAVAFGKKSHNA